jgi:uncharacterized repeat protein (TIGR02543 family)
MNGAKSVGATFGGKPVLTVVLAASESGTVTSSPAGIDCGTDCEERYLPDTIVTLTAAPAPGYAFTGWSGACAGTGPCTIAIVAGINPQVTATFEARTLYVALSGVEGAGIVTSSPAGINCGTQCGAKFPLGSVVTLTAVPQAGYTFGGWTGDCSGMQDCTLTMSANRTVHATFRGTSLFVVFAGDGEGTVISSPAGIACSVNCAAGFAAGTVVTLTATPQPGSRFAGWQGICAGLGTCVVTMDQEREVTAQFSRIASVRSDVTGDGTSDVIWYHAGTYSLIGMNANGLSLGAAYAIDVETDANWKVVGVADLNGDGRADIVWRNGVTGEVYGLLMNGGTVLSEGTILTEPNTDWKIEQVADTDGDGKADLIWKNQGTGQVLVMKMNGLAVLFGAVVYVEPNLDWKIVASGDMNGDGKSDLLWRNTATGDVFALLMDGFTVLSSGVVYSEPNAAWKIVGLADYNGDGKADILWQNTTTGDVFQMQMNGVAVSASAVIYTEPNTQWQIAALGDYNGDGKADILWRNTVTGQVYMMLMDGFAVTSAGFVYTEPDTQWQIVGP